MKTIEKQVTDNLSVQVMPDAQNEFVMTTAEVAKGYGVSVFAIRKQMSRNIDDFTIGKHLIKGVTICHTHGEKGVQPHQVFWTKRGIVRLGFFIKSERAKLFRDWVEDLVMSVTDSAQRAQNLNLLPESSKRLINRLDKDRMIRLLALTSRVADQALRCSIADELTGGLGYGK